MKDFTDIHNHIFLGADDADEDYEEGIKLLQRAYDDGVSTIICTPHFRHFSGRKNLSYIKDLFEDFKGEAEKKVPGLNLHLGQELVYCTQLPRLIEDGEVLTLANSSYVLVEFSPKVEFTDMEFGIEQLLNINKKPILAHVERYECLAYDNMESIIRLRDMGAYLQADSEAVLGNSGGMQTAFTKKLLK
ncbi:MAG: hypothetical protein K6B75_05775, partial [Lachnospiraceae bacterium]|nr:hypothetical protein [Lachnospiraceae bacterium]